MLSIVSISPADGATEVTLTPTVAIAFNSALEPSTISDTCVVIVALGTMIYDYEIGEAGIGTRTIRDPIDVTVAIDDSNPALLKVTPVNSLELGTEYSVLIGRGIENTVGDTLDAIYTSGFTTTNTAETVVDTTISTNLLSTNANIGDGRFRVISVRPLPNKVVREFSDSTEFKFTFNENVNSTNIASHIEVLYEGLLDDTEELVDSPDIIVAGNVVTITTSVLTSIPEEAVIRFRFLETLTSASGKLITGTMEYLFVQSQQPFYIPLKLLRLKTGYLFDHIQDMTLIALVAHFSEQIDIMGRSYVTEPIKQAYVFYATMYHVLTRAHHAPADAASKHLGDLKIEMTTKTQADLFNQCVKDARYNLEAIELYISMKHGTSAFIKGIATVDYPDNVGRLYDESDPIKVYKQRASNSLRSKWYTNYY